MRETVEDKFMNLEGLCAEWLKKNFSINAQIRQAIVRDQEEIDKALNLVPVECDFTNEKGEEGYTIAFLDAHQVLPCKGVAQFWSGFRTFITKLSKESA